MGGNFYGGHIAFAMDALKSALASVADMADRQVALLVNPNVNRGLPADLVRLTGEARLRHHGFKAMSISASALTAEALKATMPAASFSRSTESHNQDKVSMGTIAARDAARVCTLAERVVAIHLLAAVQACEIRGRLESRPRLVPLVMELRTLWPDRPSRTVPWMPTSRPWRGGYRRRVSRRRSDGSAETTELRGNAQGALLRSRPDADRLARELPEVFRYRPFGALRPPGRGPLRLPRQDPLHLPDHPQLRQAHPSARSGGTSSSAGRR